MLCHYVIKKKLTELRIHGTLDWNEKKIIIRPQISSHGNLPKQTYFEKKCFEKKTIVWINMFVITHTEQHWLENNIILGRSMKLLIKTTYTLKLLSMHKVTTKQCGFLTQDAFAVNCGLWRVSYMYMWCGEFLVIHALGHVSLVYFDNWMLFGCDRLGNRDFDVFFLTSGFTELQTFPIM